MSIHKSLIDKKKILLILPATEANGALNLAERIRARVSTTEIYFKEATIQITVTMGITQ